MLNLKYIDELWVIIMNDEIIEEYELSNIVLLCKSNYGIIYKCLSNIYGDVVIKINMDRKNFENSCKYYNSFKGLPLCDLYAYNHMNQVQFLKYINGKTLFDIDDFEKRVKLCYNYLKNWEHNLKIVDDNELSFETKTYDMLAHLKSSELSEKARNLLVDFDEAARNFFNKYNNCYLLHGDLHHDNMLYDGQQIIAIDLSPLKASFSIEIAKFIENELFQNVDEIDEKLNYILNIFNFDIITKEELLEGLFVDSCFRTFDSYLEGREDADLEHGINMNQRILKYIQKRR